MSPVFKSRERPQSPEREKERERNTHPRARVSKCFLAESDREENSEAETDRALDPGIEEETDLRRYFLP
jgi:hypothetical protein